MERSTLTSASLLALGLLLGTACASSDDGAPDGGAADADSDTGTDADTDADSDTDTDADTDADSDTDTDTDADGGSSFTLTSSAFEDGDVLPVKYTCDGEQVSPPLAWTGAPAGTAEFALLLTTMSVDGLKWNWVLYGVPGDLSALPEGGGIGTCGLTSDGPLLQYYAPCPHGPGAKTYFFTLYALSDAPTFPVPVEEVTGAIVTNAISGITLDSCQMSVTYAEDDAGAG